MVPFEQRALRNCQNDLLRDIEPHQGFLMSLVSENIITAPQRQEIEKEESSKAKVAKLLRFLPRRGPNVFKAFCRKIKPEFPWLVKKLEQELVKEQINIVRDLSHRLMRITNEQLCGLLYGHSRDIVSQRTHPLDVVGRIRELLHELRKSSHTALKISPHDTSVQQTSLPELIKDTASSLQEDIQKLRKEIAALKTKQKLPVHVQEPKAKKVPANSDNQKQREVTQLKRNIERKKEANKKMETSAKLKDKQITELKKENDEMERKIKEIERFQEAMLQTAGYGTLDNIIEDYN